MLVRLIYASKSTIDIEPDFISSIREKAIPTNTRLNVTGILAFNRKYFLQCLEGSAETVNEVYRKIMNDQRHGGIQLVTYTEIDYRCFYGWSMSFADIRKLSRKLYLKYSNANDFEPYTYTAGGALSLLLELPTIEPEK